MNFKNKALGITLFAITALLLAACGTGGPVATPTQDAQTVYTQAALAVQSELTQSAALTPSATPQPSDTPTLPVVPTLAVTAAPAVSQTPAAPLATLTNTVPAPGTGDDQAILVTQSVAQNTTVNAGESFKVTWTIKNTGKTTWTAMYALKWYSGMQGDSLKVPNTVNLASNVNPGESADITITFVAPAATGSAQTVWYLQNTASGANILKLTLGIQVVNGAAAATLTPTIGATLTGAPTLTAAPTITAAPTLTAAPTATPTP